MTTFPLYITEAVLHAVVLRGLEEDLGSGDVTTMATIPKSARATATFLAKADGVIAGLAVVERVFGALEGPLRIEWSLADGDRVSVGSRVGRIEGNARSILKGERLALNIVQRMSGVATATAAMVEAAGNQAQIMDTRKTAPGLRALDKWAVLLGGGSNHRVGLYDMILIKDNHIEAAGGVEEAVAAARRFRIEEGHPELAIEIEVGTDQELKELLGVGGVDRVLLDNMVDMGPDGSIDISRLARAVQRIDRRFQTEASGNVTLETVSAIASTGVDFISSGALTHSVDALDISLKVNLER